jgi:hypothetical protein
LLHRSAVIKEMGRAVKPSPSGIAYFVGGRLSIVFIRPI